MSQNSRETMQRAIGIVEGVAFVSSKEMQEALFMAAEMLHGVLTAEEGRS